MKKFEDSGANAPNDRDEENLRELIRLEMTLPEMLEDPDSDLTFAEAVQTRTDTAKGHIKAIADSRLAASKSCLDELLQKHGPTRRGGEDKAT